MNKNRDQFWNAMRRAFRGFSVERGHILNFLAQLGVEAL